MTTSDDYLDDPRNPLVRTYARTDLAGRGDVSDHHVLVVTFDHDGYVRIHGDVLVPLLRKAGYDPLDDIDELEDKHAATVELSGFVLPPSLRSVASDVIDELPDDRCRRHPGCTRMHGHGDDDEARELLRQIVMDNADRCDDPTRCACSIARATRYLAPADDYVDQGDEPHDDQPDDHIDPWAHPKHEPRCPECAIRLPAALHMPGCSRPDRTLSLG